MQQRTIDFLQGTDANPTVLVVTTCGFLGSIVLSQSTTAISSLDLPRLTSLVVSRRRQWENSMVRASHFVDRVLHSVGDGLDDPTTD